MSGSAGMLSYAYNAWGTSLVISTVFPFVVQINAERLCLVWFPSGTLSHADLTPYSQTSIVVAFEEQSDNRVKISTDRNATITAYYRKV